MKKSPATPGAEGTQGHDADAPSALDGFLAGVHRGHRVIGGFAKDAKAAAKVAGVATRYGHAAADVLDKVAGGKGANHVRKAAGYAEKGGRIVGQVGEDAHTISSGLEMLHRYVQGGSKLIERILNALADILPAKPAPQKAAKGKPAATAAEEAGIVLAGSDPEPASN